MRCLPDCSGCEMPSIGPFIDHLRKEFGKNLVLLECPETKKRNTPQPEMLLRDVTSNGLVVIERKQIVYPLGYAAGHRNDHLLADLIEDALLPHLTGGIFRLELPHLVRGSKNELRAFAVEITDRIRNNLQKVCAGVTVGSSQQGRQWNFRALTSDDIIPGESGPPLRIEFPGFDRFCFEEREKGREFITQQLGKFRTACKNKFKDFPDAKKILLLELIGNFFVGEAEWQPILDAAKPFSPIDEIWLADNDWMDNEERAWQFKEIFMASVPEIIIP